MNKEDYLEKAKSLMDDKVSASTRSIVSTYALLSIAESLVELLELKQPKPKPKIASKVAESDFVKYDGNDW